MEVNFDKIDVMRVRIGGRWHEVRSPALFAQLGLGCPLP